MTYLERIREEIAKECYIALAMNRSGLRRHQFELYWKYKNGLPEEITAGYKAADQILSLKVYKDYTIKDLIKRGVIPAENQDLTYAIPYYLGILQGEIGGLFENYSKNFNLIMTKLDDKLKEAGFIKVESR